MPTTPTTTLPGQHPSISSLNKFSFSAGGAAQPNFIDIKGEPLAGYGNGLGLGGIYTLVTGLPTSAAGAPPGTVVLAITREGSNIKLSWDASVSNVEIYQLVGDGTGKYDSSGFTLMAKVISGNTTIDAGQVGGGDKEKYYKGVMSGYANYDLYGVDPVKYSGHQTCLQAAWPVGKINLTVPVNGLALAGMPFTDSLISNVFLPQLPNSTTLYLYPRVGGGLNKVTVSRDASGKVNVPAMDFLIEPAVGFWVEGPATNASPVTITFVGNIPITEEKSLVALDLTGNPLPIPLSSSVIGAQSGDNVYPQVGSGLNKIVVGTTAWNSFTLGLGAGFWYEYGTGSRKWQIDLNGRSAKIVGY